MGTGTDEHPNRKNSPFFITTTTAIILFTIAPVAVTLFLIFVVIGEYRRVRLSRWALATTIASILSFIAAGFTFSQWLIWLGSGFPCPLGNPPPTQQPLQLDNPPSHHRSSNHAHHTHHPTHPDIHTTSLSSNDAMVVVAVLLTTPTRRKRRRTLLPSPPRRLVRPPPNRKKHPRTTNRTLGHQPPRRNSHRHRPLRRNRNSHP